MRRAEGLIIIFLLFVLFVSLFAFVSVPSRLSDLDSADYGDLSGVPSEFMPSAHNHAPSEVGLGNVQNFMFQSGVAHTGSGSSVWVAFNSEYSSAVLSVTCGMASSGYGSYWLSGVNVTGCYFNFENSGDWWFYWLSWGV